jgi:hypothetical protein
LWRRQWQWRQVRLGDTKLLVVGLAVGPFSIHALLLKGLRSSRFSGNTGSRRTLETSEPGAFAERARQRGSMSKTGNSSRLKYTHGALSCSVNSILKDESIVAFEN